MNAEDWPGNFPKMVGSAPVRVVTKLAGGQAEMPTDAVEGRPAVEVAARQQSKYMW